MRISERIFPPFSLTLLDYNVFWPQVHIANALGKARFCFILPPRVRQAPSPFSGHLPWYILEYICWSLVLPESPLGSCSTTPHALSHDSQLCWVHCTVRSTAFHSLELLAVSLWRDASFLGQEWGYMGQNLLAPTAYFFAPMLHYAQMVLGISHRLFSRGKSKGMNAQEENRGPFKSKPAYESTMVLGFLSPSVIRVVFLWKKAFLNFIHILQTTNQRFVSLRDFLPHQSISSS